LSFEFPLCTKSRSIPKEHLQLRCHHQLWACTQAPTLGTSGKFATLKKLPSPRFGFGAERPQTCRVPPFKASSSQRAFNSLPLVSSNALTLLICTFTNCAHAILRLHICTVQSQDWLCNLEITQIPRLCTYMYVTVDIACYDTSY